MGVSTFSPCRDGVQRELGCDVDRDPCGYAVAGARRNRNALGPGAGVPKRNSCPVSRCRVARVDDEASSLESGNLRERWADAVVATDEHQVGRLHDDLSVLIPVVTSPFRGSGRTSGYRPQFLSS